MRSWKQRQQQQPTGRPPPPPPPQSHIRNLDSLGHMLTEEEHKVIDKMAETQVHNPELVAMVKQAQKDNPKYQFLFTHSPLHPHFQWRVAQLSREMPGNNTAPLVNLPRPPLPRPPSLSLKPSQGPPGNGPSAKEPAINIQAAEDLLPAKQTCAHKYYELPAGLMVGAIDQENNSYSPLHASKLEDPAFLESIVPGLATYTTDLPSPETTDDLEQALKDFDKGVRYIYKEGEFEFRDDPLELATCKDHGNIDAINMDKNGWTPGVLEKVLWDRRKGNEQRQKWKRKQERIKRRLEGETVTTESESSSASSESTSSSSDSDSSDSGSSSCSFPARPTSTNKAIGSDNKGFQLLSKLGWQQGQGLGASSEGIIEPVRLSTRFSAIKSTTPGKSSRKARGKGKQVQRASLGTGRIQDPVEQAQETSSVDSKEDIYEAYRMQMSSLYKNITRKSPKN
ncbi:hypothetical protein IWW36_002268 [Coemansia brasiliensis]|uniref:G-patch domain-containing protein n=1 Tax=Coemansia brasiliensis TaxID=2650707 RepID=A0A9W8IDT4_9FUNG|nr:hypothetical protein IWW36_002268 [Coemansia brasiliensis]